MDPALHFALHLLIYGVGFGLLAAWAVLELLAAWWPILFIMAGAIIDLVAPFARRPS